MNIVQHSNNNKTEYNTQNAGNFSSEIRESSAVELLEARIIDMQQRIDELENDKNTIFNLYLKNIETDKFIKMIKNENDYISWFRYLQQMVSRFLVVMVVRDTPGSHMPKSVYKSILDAGFSNFRTDLWNSYIGVFHQGKCWFDERRSNEEKSSYFYESMDGSFSIIAKSETWKNGDRGEVIINGKQLSKNKRGVNVVIYDTSNNQLVDSVSFDSHDQGSLIFTR